MFLPHMANLYHHPQNVRKMVFWRMQTFSRSETLPPPPPPFLPPENVLIEMIRVNLHFWDRANFSVVPEP